MRGIPTLMIVPPIGKYYFMDLAPRRSFTEFAEPADPRRQEHVRAQQRGSHRELVNPPGNARSRYYLGTEPGPDPQKWLESARKHTGTWWAVWADWVGKRSGAAKPAPKRLGSRRHPILGAAPGEYVREPA